LIFLSIFIKTKSLEIVYIAHHFSPAGQEAECDLTNEMKAILDSRLQEDSSTYLTSDESIKRLNQKYDGEF
jgi:hypothetical protein